MVNLGRRKDRRATIAKALPSDLNVTYTSDMSMNHDWVEGYTQGYNLFPWEIVSRNPSWSRRLHEGEVGCVLAHWNCWNDAILYEDEYTLFLEDDAVIPPGFSDSLSDLLGKIRDVKPDLVYLGRKSLGQDCPSGIEGMVIPGFSHFTHAYLLRRSGLSQILATNLIDAIVPLDEFLPAMYMDHPRMDLRERFPKCMAALAVEPQLVRQVVTDSDIAGSRHTSEVR